MANSSVEKASSFSLANVAMGPKLIGVGVALFVLVQIIEWLPLGWIDGPIKGLLWLAILASVAAGAGLTYLKSKRS